MENDKLRQHIHAALDECFAYTDERPSQKYRILNRIQGEGKVKKRISATLVFAIILVIVLCGGVVASELGVFAQFGAQSENSGERLDHLDEAASVVGETVTSDAGFTLTLEQAYCDGSRLYFAYTLAGDGFTLGDGADTEDGTSMTIWDRADELNADGTTSGYQEVELPEGMAQDAPFTAVLTVIDGKKEGSDRFIDVPFTVTPSSRVSKTGSAAFDEYAAEAMLYLSGVEAYGQVTVTGPESWKTLYQRRADTDTEDYIVDYLLIADGDILYNQEYLYGGETETSYGVAVRYDLPQSCESLTLRPVRYLSGECPDEDIALH